MPWIQLILDATDRDPEQLEDALLAAGAASVTFSDAADQPIYEPDLGTTPLWSHTRITGLFDAETDMDGVLTTLEILLAGALPPHKTEILEDRDWVRAWMDQFHPMRFGQRLWIVPSGYAAPDPNAVNILLDPGLAFGTGTHPTTALCLEWLDGAELSAADVVDYGCGSGILAVAAARLGARHVWATDIDPQALLATLDNARKNHVAERIAAVVPGDLPALHADVMLANILAGPLVQLAPALAALTRTGGQLVLSGILAQQADEVRSAYQTWFEMAEPAERESWVRLEGRRKAD